MRLINYLHKSIDTKNKKRVPGEHFLYQVIEKYSFWIDLSNIFMITSHSLCVSSKV